MSGELVLAFAQAAFGVVVVAAACLLLRRRMITRGGGVVECCLLATSSSRWQHGLAEYRNGRLCWHRSLSLRIGPHAVFDRRDLVPVASRPAGAGDAAWLGAGTMIVTCQPGRDQARSWQASWAQTRRAGWARATRSRLSPAWPEQARAQPPATPATALVIELAMSQAALTGYLAWLEAAPAGYLSGAS